MSGSQLSANNSQLAARCTAYSFFVITFGLRPLSSQDLRRDSGSASFSASAKPPTEVKNVEGCVFSDYGARNTRLKRRVLRKR